MSRTTHVDRITTPVALHVALELSKKTWKCAFALDRIQKPRIWDVPAGDLDKLLEAVQGARRALGVPESAPVRSCYEAGRDGFWIDRALKHHGIENVIFEAASIEVSRRKRNVKTDRVDATKLVRLLVRHHEGESVVKIVRVPPVEAEDERRFPRLLKRLKNERTALVNAIRGALFVHGIDLSPRLKSFRKELEGARQWNGQPLPVGSLEEIRLHTDRLKLLETQIKNLENRQSALLKAAANGSEDSSPAQRMAAGLYQLKGVGETGAYVLATEFFAWRKFENRKQLGSLAGLVGVPFCSGGMNRDQGISKAGNARVRALLIQQSWGWLRLQPDSALSLWFHEHVGKSGSRSKRKAIVALARKLLISLWHFVEHGVIPTGATFKSQAQQAAV